MHVPEDRATPGGRVHELGDVDFPARRRESAPPFFTPCGRGFLRSYLAGAHPKQVDAACASSEAERTPVETTP